MSKNTICFNIHPIKTLCYKLKTGKTLVFKGRLRANTGIGLNTYPMSTGEILEQVCRMFTDGYTEGNRSIKVVGDTVTYNTASTDKGDLYCIAYKDGGFYVGKRTSEDYEPKEGDWWCYSMKSDLYSCQSNYLPQDLIFTSYVLAYPKRYDKIVSNWIEQPQLQSTIGLWSKLQSNTTPAQYKTVSNRNGLFVDYHNATRFADGILVKADNSLGAKDDLDVNRMKRYTFVCRPISASDILSYKVTGHMNHLIVGNASISHPRDSGKFIFGSNAGPTFNNTWDFNTKYLLMVTDETGNIYNLRQLSTIYFYVKVIETQTQIASCQINVDYINGCFVTTETLAEKLSEEYSDTTTYVVVNGYDNQTQVPTSYILYKIPILQDNRPATLNALNTNLLNSNQTDIQPINNDEDDE